ncbi:MAG: serine/threonine protein kinase [Burkholderiaceae bacterium]|nr:serine/threonine protein kinase [Burkholderiaceae bacterium]
MMPLPARSSPSAQSSNRVSRFYIIREIGSGAAGTVYVARDPVVDRNVAIKISRVRSNPAEKKQYDQQLINEARAAGRLSHPNIITIFEAGSDNGNSYIAMEYLQGAVLGRRMEGGDTFTPDEVVAIAAKLADALAHAHKNGVIHRDINPSNIFLSDDKQPKIFDFGIARAPNRLSEDADDDEPVTLFQNNLLGTPNYMSPEQAQGKQVDHLTDLYSLGAVMYEMLTQRKPFQGETTEALLEAVAYKAPTAPHELNSAVPVGLSQIVLKAMSKRPEKRYQSAEEFLHDLNRYLGLNKRHSKPAVQAPEPEPEAVKPAKQDKPAASRAPIAAIVAFVVGAGLASAWFLLH